MAVGDSCPDSAADGHLPDRSHAARPPQPLPDSRHEGQARRHLPASHCLEGLSLPALQACQLSCGSNVKLPRWMHACLEPLSSHSAYFCFAPCALQHSGPGCAWPAVNAMQVPSVDMAHGHVNTCQPSSPMLVTLAKAANALPVKAPIRWGKVSKSLGVNSNHTSPKL